MTNKEVAKELYIGKIIDVGLSLGINQILLNLLVVFKTQGKSLDDLELLKILSREVYDKRLHDLNTTLRLKHRPELVKPVNEYFEPVPEDLMNKLNTYQLEILEQLKDRDRSEVIIYLYLDSLLLAEDYINDQVNKYGAMNINEVTKVYLANEIEELIQLYNNGYQ